jgi:uncharacterized small protein (DUF1192 family)
MLSGSAAIAIALRLSLPRFVQGFIDMAGASVNACAMDVDDVFPKRAGDPLTALAGQDLDPFSVDELHARIAALEAEIVRVRHRIDAAVNHKTSADALFRR